MHLHQHLILKNWINGRQPFRNRFKCLQRRKSERPEQNLDLRCQSEPWAKDSVIFCGGDSSKNFGADQQRVQISDLYFDKFPTPATFACWKIRFKTEVCTCSQFPYGSNAMDQGIGVGWFSGRFKIFVIYSCISMPNFEVLDARIASALTKTSIIPISKEESVWRNKKGPERGPFPSRQTDCLLDLRSLPGPWKPWFCRKLHRPVHYCSSKWSFSGIRF